MRKVLSAALVAVALLLLLAPGSQASGRYHRSGGGTRVFVGVGPAYWYGGYPYWHYPYPYYYPYYYPPYYYTPPSVVVQEPPVYVQQPPPAESSAAEATPPAGYWYYCASAREYYPKAPTCNEAWIKVPPRQE